MTFKVTSEVYPNIYKDKYNPTYAARLSHVILTSLSRELILEAYWSMEKL